MLAVLALIAPLFGLIALGFAIGRTTYLAQGAGKVLAEFGFKVAMPALLFRAAAGFAPLPSSPLPLLAAYFGASALVWIAATLAARWLLRRPPGDDAAVAMGCCFGNTVMLGIPLCLIAFGESAATPAAIIVAVETPMLWVIATLHAEWTTRRSGIGWKVLRGIALDLLRNPIIMSIVLGVLWRFGGIPIPETLDRFLALLGQAAIPTALAALGLTLSQFEIRGEAPTLGVICVFKLLLFPLLAFLTTSFAGVPPVWAAVAVIFAAMPVGANAYLFAVRYDRVVNSVAGSLALSTVIAAATVSLLLWAAGW
jgi:malonate transporter and related proteins